MLSIITNFGCHYKCPECIVRNNKLKIPKTTVQGLEKLSSLIGSETEISISGGGDPLFNYALNINYYNRLFNILKLNKCGLEMHTTYTDSEFPYENCSRVVYHLHLENSLKHIIKHGKEIVRVVYVIDANYTKQDLWKIFNEVKNNINIDEITFRQYVDDNYVSHYYLHNELLKGHAEGYWYYVTQYDYNDYYVNGKIFKKFNEIK